MAETLSNSLAILIHQVNAWLTPTVEADCRRQDAAGLRVFLKNLEAARDQAVGYEEGLTPENSLAASVTAVAQSMTHWRKSGVTFRPQDICAYVAILNEAASHAWALEVALRQAAGTLTDDDFETLALAHRLRQGKVFRASRLAEVIATESGDGGVA